MFPFVCFVFQIGQFEYLTTMKLLSINIGRPRLIAHAGRRYTTSINKQPVDGPVEVTFEHVGDDRQADTKNHGGPHMVACVYPSEHYPAVADFLGLDALPTPSFGENFTTQGLLEDDIAIGDRLRIGGALFEVSMPRQPCSKLARKHNRPDLMKFIHDTGHTGFYLRVIEPGVVHPDETIERVAQPYPELTIARCMHAMFDSSTDADTVRAFADCEALSPVWRKRLMKEASE